MNIHFSIFNINHKIKYSPSNLIQFENTTEVKEQKCRTSVILLNGFIIYSLLATVLTPNNYVHGKVTNISIALFFILIIFLVSKTKNHTWLCIFGSFGTCCILFLHLLTEVDWTIGMDAFWLFILILPFITDYIGGVIYGSISALSGLFLSILLFDTGLKNYLQPYGKNMVDWFPIIYIVVMFAAAIMEYELTSYQIEKKIADEKLTYYQNERTQRLTEQISIYESNELTIRKYKHDIRHFNRVLAGLIKNKEYDKASEYLQEFDSMLEQVTAVSFCENKIVNELLTIYTARCQKLGFRLRAKAVIPELIPMEGLELTSLVANALENALEAQLKVEEKSRYIQFEIIYDGKKLKLMTRNSCDKNLSFSGEGTPISTKEVQSGIGTQQIKAIAKKYNGVASFSAENGAFLLRAVMTCM